MPGPLDGIRVLDLTAMVSGPVAAMMLGDQGADVIKIEPLEGERMRLMRRHEMDLPPSFFCCNRSKRSIALDLKSDDGRDILRRLIETADVLIQNFRPGAMERMGFGEPAVRAMKPDIIYVSISGFGEKGPYAKQRVYDPIIQALCGLADIQRDQQTGVPKMVRTIIPDKTTSVTAAQAITAALFHRERSGEGQHIQVAMLDVMVAYLWPEGMAGLTYVGQETDPARAQMGLDLVFATQDGYISAGAISDSEWQGMCRAFNRPDLIDDTRFATASARTANTAERRAVMSGEVARWESAEILKRLMAEDVPCAPILKREELLDNEQVAANEILEVTDWPSIGPVRQPRPAARFDKTPQGVQSSAPLLGEHGDEILEEIGFEAERIAELKSGGVVGGAG